MSAACRSSPFRPCSLGYPSVMLRLCSLILCLHALVCLGAAAQAAGHLRAGSTRADHTFRVDGLGNGTADLTGKWQFHVGDDPRWASPAFDDAAWESLTTDSPWGAQGHPAYTGVAWYRRDLDIEPAPGAPRQYRVLIPHAEDAYEVYWNGQLIGRYGHFPPHASWYYSVFPRSFPLPGATRGVLALRVWTAPLEVFSVAESGGLYAPPVVGDADTISLYEQAITWEEVRENLFDYSLILLRVFLATLCVILWLRNRKQQLFLWVGVFTVTPVAIGVLQNLFFLRISYQLARFLNQPLYVLSNVSLWFLLVWLLQVNKRSRLLRWTKSLAWFAVLAGLANGLLALFWERATPWMQATDAALAALIIATELFPFVIIVVGMRRRPDLPRSAVALAALLSQFVQTFADASALGRRFTHSTLYDSVIDNHSFQIQGVIFGPQKVTSLTLFVAILYAVYRYVLIQQARRAVLEQEIESAREMQRVLIPETLPLLEGYAITSAYAPAQEVGGDFFQIMTNQDGSTTVAIGDVSGKGLKAAMNVSMILGAMRAQAACTSSPAVVLNGLNQSLVGRMHGGFATCIIVRLDPEGMVTFANAGHLPPFLNGMEFPLDPSLPLGISGLSDYGETTVQLQLHDQLSFYTDGVLEARNPDGELYGFDRLHSLFAARPTAAEASHAAAVFGQEDDITVLILTRLARGEESTTTVVVPTLEDTVEFAA